MIQRDGLLTAFNAPKPARAARGARGYTMNAAKNGVGEIFIYDVIGDPWDGTTAKQFAKDLKALGGVSELRIFINSPGGSVFDAAAIFNQLHRHNARKLVSIDGMALSAASVIAMVGDEIAMAGNAMMMIHDPWTLGFGTAAEFRKMADMLDKVESTIVDTYAARTGLKDTQIADMMHEETWMTAAEAVDLGFADSVGDEVEIAAKVRGFDLSKYQHPPSGLVKAIESKPATAPTSEFAARIAAMRRRLEPAA